VLFEQSAPPSLMTMMWVYGNGYPSWLFAV
jgi:hypothetical protein